MAADGIVLGRSTSATISVTQDACAVIGGFQWPRRWRTASSLSTKRRVSSAVCLDEVRRPRATDFRAGRQSPDGGRRDAQTDSGVQELTDLSRACQ